MDWWRRNGKRRKQTSRTIAPERAPIIIRRLVQFLKKSGKAGHRELLGASIRAEFQFLERVSHGFRLKARFQIVHQRLALLGETQLHKIQKTPPVQLEQHGGVPW